MEQFVIFFRELLNDWGIFSYILIFLFAVFESTVVAGLFVPGVLAVVALGFLAAGNGLEFTPLLIVISLGACIGDYISFWLGKSRGGRTVVKLADKFIKNKDYIRTGENFFERYGNKSVLIGRFVAVVRPFIPFVAGIFKMNWKKFLFWNALGAVLWSVIYLSVGYFFGYAWELVVRGLSGVGLIILLIAIVITASYLWRKRIMNKI